MRYKTHKKEVSLAKTVDDTRYLEYNDILHWPIFGGKMITAGVMGLVKKFRYILVTNALLHLLEPDELDMVIAHEIGHVKKMHLVFYLVFFAGFLLISHTVVKLIILLTMGIILGGYGLFCAILTIIFKLKKKSVKSLWIKYLTWFIIIPPILIPLVLAPIVFQIVILVISILLFREYANSVG